MVFGSEIFSPHGYSQHPRQANEPLIPSITPIGIDPQLDTLIRVSMPSFLDILSTKQIMEKRRCWRKTQSEECCVSYIAMKYANHVDQLLDVYV
jgi:hypothetical protein